MPDLPTAHTPRRERRQRGCAHGRKGWTDESDPVTGAADGGDALVNQRAACSV